jgi:phage baseplate assembly protein W
MSEQEKLGIDLKLKFDTVGADLNITRKGDLSTITAEDNLLQAITMRLSTEKGELYDLGHPDYGSRLFDVAGEVNNELTRQQIKLIVEECLSEENRIKKIVRINVTQDRFDQHRVNVEVTVIPKGTEQYLTLTYPFSLEG